MLNWRKSKPALVIGVLINPKYIKRGVSGSCKTHSQTDLAKPPGWPINPKHQLGGILLLVHCHLRQTKSYSVSSPTLLKHMNRESTNRLDSRSCTLTRCKQSIVIIFHPVWDLPSLVEEDQLRIRILGAAMIVITGNAWEDSLLNWRPEPALSIVLQSVRFKHQNFCFWHNVPPNCPV